MSIKDIFTSGLVADYLPPSNPTRQDLSSGVTTANVDFGRATGVTTSSVSASLSKPAGSTATISSTSDTGSAWRVALSGLTNGEAYIVGLEYTGVDGQKTYSFAEVTIGAGAAGWLTLVNLDFTSCTSQTGFGTDATRTGVIGGQSVSIVTSHTTGTEGTTVASLVNGSGFEVTHTPTVTTPPQNRTFGFDISTLYGSDINPDINELCVEFVVAISSMPTNSDTLTFELGETNPVTSSNPGYYAKLQRSSSTLYKMLSGYRVTSTSTDSTGQTFKTSSPTSFHCQLVGMRYSWNAYSEESLSLSLPTSPSISGNCGGPSVAPADSISSVWGTSQWAQITVTGYAAAAPVIFTIKSIRILAKQPLS